MSELVVEFSRAAPQTFFDRWIIDRSKAIAAFGHGPFSHGDYVLGEEHGDLKGALLGASDAAGFPVIYGNPRGVAIRPPNYQQFAIRHRARIPCTLDQKAAYERFLFDQINKPFDHGALKFKVFLSIDYADRDWRDDKLWYCHELLVRGYEVAKVLWWKLVGIKNRITGSDHLLIINPVIDVDAFWTPLALVQ